MRLTSYLTRGLTAVTLGFVVSSAFAADLTPAPVNDNLNAVLWDQTPSSSRRTRLAHMRSERSEIQCTPPIFPLVPTQDLGIPVLSYTCFNGL